MKHGLLLSVAAAALIAGSTFSNAQGPAGAPGGAGAASERAAPGGGAGGNMGGAPGGMSGSASERGAPSATPMNRDAAEPRAGGRQSTQSNEAPNAKGGMNRNADTKDGARDMDRKDMDRNADTKDGMRDPNRNADSKGGGKDDNRNAQSREPGREGAEKGGTTTGQAAAGGKQMTTEQRTQVTSVIRETKVQPVTNINFSISVGTRVPREVRFHPLPARIVTIYPDWRDYEFFLARDEIIVVNPRTLEIVAVLPA